MTRSERPVAERNAGAFMGPDIMVPTPMGTLGDESARDSVEHDDDALPDPPRPTWFRRLIDRLTTRRDRS